MGAVRVSSKAGPRGSSLNELLQSGSLKFLFPRVSGATGLQTVLVNTAGGVTGGDHFRISADAGAGSRVTLTTQAAERIYRAQTGETATITTELSVAANARLDWLPQETILFNRSALRRSLSIRMAADATFLAVEPLVFGRKTMGETLDSISFRDMVRLYRGEDLIFADTIRLTGDAAAQLGSPYTAGGAAASAGVLYAAPDAGRHLARLQALMPATGGVSLIRPGLLFVRLLAEDSFLLRRSLIPVIEAIYGAALPRTWTL